MAYLSVCILASPICSALYHLHTIINPFLSRRACSSYPLSFVSSRHKHCPFRPTRLHTYGLFDPGMLYSLLAWKSLNCLTLGFTNKIESAVTGAPTFLTKASAVSPDLNVYLVTLILSVFPGEILDGSGNAALLSLSRTERATPA